MFAAEFEPAVGDHRRRLARAPVSLQADTGDGPGAMARALCRVIDVSRHGCKIQTYSALRRGIAIWITLPGHGCVKADVVWVNDFVAGCQFHHPLTTAALDMLVHRNM